MAANSLPPVTIPQAFHPLSQTVDLKGAKISIPWNRTNSQQAIMLGLLGLWDVSKEQMSAVLRQPQHTVRASQVLHGNGK